MIPHRDLSAGEIDRWAYLGTVAWGSDELIYDIGRFLSEKPSARTVINCLTKVEEAKIAPFLSDMQHVALANAGLMIAKHLQASASEIKSVGKIIHAAKDACKAVRTPEELQLWLIPELRPILRDIIERAFVSCEHIEDSVFSSNIATPSILTFICDFTVERIPELNARALSLKHRMQPFVSAYENGIRDDPKLRSLMEKLNSLKKFNELSMQHINDISEITGIIYDNPDVGQVLGVEIVALCVKVGRSLKSASMVDRNAEMIPSILNFSKALIKVAKLDGLDPNIKFQLIHAATLLPWKCLRKGRKTAREILKDTSKDAFEIFCGLRNDSLTHLHWKMGGEIASIYLHRARPNRRSHVAQTGCNWFERACPNGYSDLVVRSDKNQTRWVDFHFFAHAWLECLEAAYRYKDAENAAKYWLRLDFNIESETVRSRLLRHLAEIKLKRISALGKDSEKESITEFKNLLSDIALSEGERDPDIYLTKCGILHYMLAVLYFALQNWNGVIKQAGRALHAQPSDPGNSNRQIARAKILNLEGSALAKLGRTQQALCAFSEANKTWWSAENVCGLLGLLYEQGDESAFVSEILDPPPAMAKLNAPPRLLEVLQRAIAPSGNSNIAFDLIEHKSEWLYDNNQKLSRVARPCQTPPLAGWLRRCLHPELPFLENLWSLFLEEVNPENMNSEARMLATYLAALKYQTGNDKNALSYVLALVIDGILASPANDRAWNLAIYVSTFCEYTFELVLHEYAKMAEAALMPNEEYSIGNWDEFDKIIRGEKWVNAKPKGYFGQDRFSSADRLRRFFTVWLDAELLSAASGDGVWTQTVEDTHSQWLRGGAWLHLQVFLRKLVDPESGAARRLYGRSPSGGLLRWIIREKTLTLRVELKEPVSDTGDRLPINADIEAWCETLPRFWSPGYLWSKDGSIWDIELKPGAIEKPGHYFCEKSVEKLFDGIFEGRQTDMIDMKSEVEEWLCQQQDGYYKNSILAVTEYLLDYVTYRTRLWLVEEYVGKKSGSNESKVLHPREVTHNIKSRADMTINAQACAELIKLMLRYSPGAMRPINLSEIIRDRIIERRANPDKDLTYILDLEPGCTIKMHIKVAEAILAEMCANAERAAKSAAMQHRSVQTIIITLHLESGYCVLTMKNPIPKTESLSGAAGMGAMIVTQLAQWHGGEFLGVATPDNKNWQAKVRLPAAFDSNHITDSISSENEPLEAENTNKYYERE
jgi:tetratricopeptide (TPR) repeat protein